MLYFIVNTKSRTGKAKSIWEEVKSILMENGVLYKAYATKDRGYATRLMTWLCKNNHGRINVVVLGGDGTINEVINGITDFERIYLGVIPTGSGNDFAGGIGMSGSIREYVMNVINAVNNDTGLLLDVGTATWNDGKEKRRFLISSGAGLDALVCKMALTSKLKEFLNKIKLGNLTYVLLTIYSLFSMETSDVEVKFEDEEGVEALKRQKLIFFAAMNLRAEGGGVCMAPKATPYDGFLSVCMAYGIKKWKAFFDLPFLVVGKHEKLKGFELKNTKKVTLTSDKPLVLHTDGEYCGEVYEVVFDCEGEKLHLMV